MSARSNQLTIERMLAESGWVWGLARSLVGDDPTADDVVQEAWVAALRHPPTRAADGAVRNAWLARVVRRAASRFKRAADRRAVRERAAARENRAPPADRALERESVREKLVSMILELEEPYQSALLLRFLDGLPPREVARRTGANPSTVRNHIQRGLALLRARLEAERDPGGRPWMMVLMPLIPKAGAAEALWMGVKIVSIQKTAAGLVGLVALLCGWLAWRAWDARVPDTGTHAVAPSALESPIAHPDASEPLATAENLRSAAAPVADPSAALAELYTLERGSGRPLAEVEVWIGDGRLSLELGSDRKDGPDVETVLQSRGRRFVSDDEGRVSLPGDLPEYCLACARSGELFGQASFVRNPDERAVMELAIDRSVTVQVLAQDGQPAPGVEVALRVWGTDYDGIEWLRRTDEHGIARLLHFDHVYGDEPWGGGLPFLEFPFPLGEPLQRALDPENLPSEPVTLELPPTGSVSVVVADADGQPLREANWVFLTRVADSAAEARGRDRPRRYSRLAEGGRAVFTHVGLDLDLRIGAQSPSFPTVFVIREGPSRAGEAIEVSLPVGEPYPLFIGKLVDPSGGELPAGGLAAHLVERESQAGLHARADVTDGGGLRVTVIGELEPGGRYDLRIEDKHSEPSRSAVVENIVWNAQSPLDLGTVELAPAPVLVAGSVLDERGHPVPDAVIWVLFWETEYSRWNNFGGQPLTRTDAKGRFELRAALSDGDYGVAARKPGHFQSSPAVAFALGAQDVQILLERTGSVHGSVQLEPALQADRIHVRLEYSRDLAGLPTAAVLDTRLRPGGGFAIEDVPPGVVRVLVEGEGIEESLAVIESVHVAPAEACRDPRIQGIDLRGRARRLELTIRDESGAPVAQGHVALRPAGSESTPWRRVAFSNGKLSVLALDAVLDLEVHASGFLVAEVQGVRSDRAVTLSAGLPVQVRLPLSFDPPADVTLLVALVPERLLFSSPGWRSEGIRAPDGSVLETWCEWTSDLFHPLVGHREIRLGLPGPGRYAVRWKLRSLDGGRARVPTQTRAEIEVGPAGLDTVLELRPDDAALADAMRMMQGR